MKDGKPDLLLLHGALGTAEQLKPLVEKLQNQFTVETFSFMGHGSNPLPEQQEFGIPAFVDQLEQYLEPRKAFPPLIFGYSMGGYVAFMLARKRPELFRYILSFGTKLSWNKEAVSKEVGFLRLEFLEDKQPAYLERIRALHSGNWPDILSNTAAMMTGLGEENLLPAEAMAEIKVPITLAVGDRDRMVSVEETRHWAEKAPLGSLMVLPHTAHPVEKIGIIAVEIMMLLLRSAK